MANRHLSRSIVLQSLFEWDFRGKNDTNIGEIVERDTNEFAPGLSDFSFIKNLTEGIVKKSQVIDSIIEKAAPEWPIERISVIDRNILRIGLFELLFADKSDVPPKVAINESIELAKTFGGETSGKFVNGVLGAVYKELGEPGKDDLAKKKKNHDISKAPIEDLVGAVVYAKHDDDVYLALLHDIFGHWTLSKGHLKEDEEIKDAVVRKVAEELGLPASVGEELGNNEYIASDPEKGKIRKKVSYFLAEAPYQDLHLGESGGLDDARWFKLEEILDLNFYDDIMPVITKGVQILSEK
jgi:N utilization substance protein B